MAGQNHVGTNMDQFEVYFKRADLDGDGRISGAEAVAFFQGSNLPKNVLAQIWMHADLRKVGFLGRPEFYNALRLVTVAQSKRELTPEIVKAALNGPAAAKIPAPQINLPTTPVPQTNRVAAASGPLMGTVTPAAYQNYGLRAPVVPNIGVNQQSFPSQPNQSIKPPMSVGVASQPIQVMQQAMTVGVASRPPPSAISPSELPKDGNVGVSNLVNSNSSNDWIGGSSVAAPPRPGGLSPPVALPASSSQPPVLASSQPMSIDSKALVVSGNGFGSDSGFGGDFFPASPSSSRGGATSSAIVPVSGGPKPSDKHSSLGSLQSAFSMQSSGGQLQPVQTSMNRSQPASVLGSSSRGPSGITVAGNSTSENSQIPWPQMKLSDIQKYTKVFMEVDTDRDGKISGEQARNLFLSWRLPREVLKQVWDLSDQDSDSMLSLREFCFALYLMERYREGRPLPAALPSNVMYDETLLSMTGLPRVAYGNASWGASSGGFGHPKGPAGSQRGAPTATLRPPLPTSSPKLDGSVHPSLEKLGKPVIEDSFLSHHDNGQHSTAKNQEAAVAEKKVAEAENVILDSKEKIEFYRTKMQELVLYKSRCDNRLNEITERASADKREAESLGKKYEEKYKQVAEIASKLTVEEGRFRDIQERKIELQQAIVKMEKGGSADGILQVRADRIQSDLEELTKALAERCKNHGIDVKSAAMIKLPIGWLPGIPEEVTVWDEDWDKFEDEGFANDLALNTKSDSGPTGKSVAVHSEKAYPDYNSTPDSLSKINGNKGDSFSTVEHGLESESAYSHSDDESAKSPRDSPAGRSTLESPSQGFHDAHHGKNSEADTETHSFDESTWGAFDNNDDVDSVWGFNPANAKDSDSEKRRDLFGPDSFRVDSIKLHSPKADSVFQRKSPFFEESVPATPLSRFGNNSPRYSEASGDHYFDNFSRFDSFGRHDGGFSPRESFTRFDSLNSSRDLGGNHERLTRFDSMSSTRDFGQNSQVVTRFDSMSSNRDFPQHGERHTRFDSISSAKDLGYGGAFSFDDADPFGSFGPFKASSESSHNPKRDSDHRGAL